MEMKCCLDDASTIKLWAPNTFCIKEKGRGIDVFLCRPSFPIHPLEGYE